MDDQHAWELLQAERARLEQVLSDGEADARADRQAIEDASGLNDDAESLTAEAADDATSAAIRGRLAAIARAEQRLKDGTFGRSIRSGAVIPDERLEADPAAELTVDEANER